MQEPKIRVVDYRKIAYTDINIMYGGDIIYSNNIKFLYSDGSYSKYATVTVNTSCTEYIVNQDGAV